MNESWTASPIRRRAFVGLTVAVGAGLVLPRSARAATQAIDPYKGVIPLVFPLESGSYQSPVVDNWHALREGDPYPWSHQNAGQRAHDGVALYPPTPGQLPRVYAPLNAVVAAVCLRSSNALAAAPDYRASRATPPPWDYSRAVDTVANLPLYGNFVWLISADPASAGYFLLFSQLQNEALLQGLAVDQPVDQNTALGMMGDSGNAVGSPQLHVELHYPLGTAFRCRHCSPEKAGLTSIDPFASLVAARSREAATTPEGGRLTRRAPVTGVLDGRSVGAVRNYTFSGDGAPVILSLSYAPRDPIADRGVGFIVYDDSGKVVVNQTEVGNQDGLVSASIPTARAATYTIQVYDYLPARRISYTLTMA